MSIRHTRGADGDTPLNVLIWRKDWEAARLLINAGADVNASGDMGETPLHLAVKQGDLPLVKHLLLAGADPDIRPEFGKTARGDTAGRGGPMENVFRRLPKKAGVNSWGT